MVTVALTDTHKRWIALVAFAVAALLAVDAIYQVGTHLQWRGWINNLRNPEPAATTQPTTQPTDTQPTATQPADTQPAETQPSETQPGAPQPPVTPPPSPPPGPPPQATGPPKVHGAIALRNVLAPPPPPRKKLQLTGVLGDTALFMAPPNRPVAIDVGQAAHGIKVVRIEGYAVTIEHHGQAETIHLFPPDQPPSSPTPPQEPTAQPITTTQPTTALAETPPSGDQPTAPATAPSTQPKGTD